MLSDIHQPPNGRSTEQVMHTLPRPQPLSFSYGAPSQTSTLAPPKVRANEFSSPRSASADSLKASSLGLLTLPTSTSQVALPPAALPLGSLPSSFASFLLTPEPIRTVSDPLLSGTFRQSSVDGADVPRSASPPWNDRLPLHRELSIRAKFFVEPASPRSPAVTLERLDSFGSSSSLSPLPLTSPSLFSSASVCSLNTESDYTSLQVGEDDLPLDGPLLTPPTPLMANLPPAESLPPSTLDTLPPLEGLSDQDTDTDSEPGVIASERRDGSPSPKRVRLALPRATSLPPHIHPAPSRPAKQDPANDHRVMVGTLTQLERNEALRIYRAKRARRNFSRVVYACRKSFADSRPRVAGRFIKKDPSERAPKAKPTVSAGKKRSHSALDAETTVPSASLLTAFASSPLRPDALDPSHASDSQETVTAEW